MFGTCIFWMLSFMYRCDGRLAFFFKIWSICSNDYASKTRIKILCKKTCCIAPHVLGQLNFLGNSWDDRTLARMSTWKILGVMPTATTTTMMMMTTSQQPPHPTATSKQTRTGTKNPVWRTHPHSDYRVLLISTLVHILIGCLGISRTPYGGS